MRSVKKKELALHEPEDVSHYVKMLFEQNEGTAWQCIQAIEAIRHLYLAFDISWLDEIDWAYLKDSVLTLKQNHATLARETQFEHKKEVVNEFTMAAIRKHHAAILGALRNEIRRRHYSIRTEQAYEG